MLNETVVEQRLTALEHIVADLQRRLVSASQNDASKLHLRQARSMPVHLTDPVTKEEYVLLRAEVYEHLRTLLYDDREITPEMGYILADEVMREDWDDPKMAEYDRYEEHRQ